MWLKLALVFEQMVVALFEPIGEQAENLEYEPEWPPEQLVELWGLGTKNSLDLVFRLAYINKTSLIGGYKTFLFIITQRSGTDNE